MFENKTEQQARENILEMVREYADTFHTQKKEFKVGQRIPYASRVYDSAEMVNLVDSTLDFWLIWVQINRQNIWIFLRKSIRLWETGESVFAWTEKKCLGHSFGQSSGQVLMEILL